MQRPRRTSEFLDETVGTSIRKLRSTLRTQTTPSTTQRCPLKQAAVPTRNSSSDRAYTLTASRGTTPLRLQNTSRSLFPISTLGVTALHNDKKFLQEQTLRITDHLRQAASAGYTNLEFINHTGLRQMSIKQFIAVVNYFLHFIAGNRLSIGSNYVEDIVQVLQKLEYPYTINKSWLKTPNAQHSYGNVVILFNYMLDFVPSMEEFGQWSFPLEDIKAHCLESPSESDRDFQAEIILHCEKAFLLWDKQYMKEYGDMQLLTSDLYIKACGLENAVDLEVAMRKLRHSLDHILSNSVAVPKEMLNQQYVLLDKHRDILDKKVTVQNELNLLDYNKRQLHNKIQFIRNQLVELQVFIEKLQQQIHQQLCSSQQRAILIDRMDHNTHVLKAQDRIFWQIQDKNNCQQVGLSRLKKYITDELEQLSLGMRNLCEIVIHAGAKDKCSISVPKWLLNLPLNLQPIQFEYTIKQLKSLHEHIEVKKVLIKQLLHENIRKLDESEVEIKYKLVPECELAVDKLAIAEKFLMKRVSKQQRTLEKLVEQRHQLNIKIYENKFALSDLSVENDSQREIIARRMERNELIMTEIEEKTKTKLVSKEKFLKKFEEQLDINMSELLELQILLNKFERLNDEIEAHVP